MAEVPDGEIHFEMVRPLAERPGSSLEHLDRGPGEAIDSFALTTTAGTAPKFANFALTLD